MYSTYKFFSDIYNKELETTQETEICVLYKKTQRPDIIATYYCMYMNAIVFWHEKYNLKEESQTASIALECLDYCLSNYDGSSSFKTYFNNGLKLRLLSQKQYEMGKKRNCGITVDIDSNEIEVSQKDFENIKFNDLIENSNLTVEQKDYCNYYLTVENPSDTQFCRSYGINKRKLILLKKSLKNKFNIVYA